MKRALAILAVALVLVAAPSLAPVGALASEPGTWRVTGQTTIEGRPMVLARDVVVAPGGTLRLKGVNATAVSVPTRSLSITVESNGTLELVDGRHAATQQVQSTRVHSSAAPLRIELKPGSNMLADNATLAGVRVEAATGNATFRGTMLRLPWGPFEVQDGHTEIRQSRLWGSPDELVEVEGGTVEIVRSRLHDADRMGIHVGAGGRAVVRDSRIKRPGGVAAAVDQGTLVLEGNRLRDASLYLVRAEDADVRATGNRFASAHCGIDLIRATGTLRNNTFLTGDRGVSIFDGDVRIEDNRFEGITEALHAVKTASRIEGNVFAGNSRAVVALDAPMRIEANRFVDNGAGVKVRDVGTDLPVLRTNGFDDHERYAVRNRHEDPLDARWNWWGHRDGPNSAEGETMLGPVDTDPWLRVPPARLGTAEPGGS